MDVLDPLRLYFSTVKKIPKISRAEMLDLLKRIKRGDKKAKRRMIEGNLRLVISIAKKYHRRDISFLDLIEEGNLGLMKAVKKFNIRRGYYFSTYASFWIKQYIKRAIDAQTRTIKIPEHMLVKLKKWVVEWEKLKHKLGRNPTMKEMSKKLGISYKQISGLLENLELSKSGGSLDAPLDREDETASLKDMISDEGKDSPERIISALKMSKQIDNALAKLQPKEAKTIQMRFGLGDTTPCTLEKIGTKLDISRERVRQLEERALLKLKRIALRMELI